MLLKDYRQQVSKTRLWWKGERVLTQTSNSMGLGYWVLVVSCSWQIQSRSEFHFDWLIQVLKTRQSGDGSMQSCCVHRTPKDQLYIAFHLAIIQNAISPIVYHAISSSFTCLNLPHILPVRPCMIVLWIFINNAVNKFKLLTTIIQSIHNHLSIMPNIDL